MYAVVVDVFSSRESPESEDGINAILTNKTWPCHEEDKKYQRVNIPADLSIVRQFVSRGIPVVCDVGTSKLIEDYLKSCLWHGVALGITLPITVKSFEGAAAKTKRFTRDEIAGIFGQSHVDTLHFDENGDKLFSLSAYAFDAAYRKNSSFDILSVQAVSPMLVRHPLPEDLAFESISFTPSEAFWTKDFVYVCQDDDRMNYLIHAIARNPSAVRR